jgi:hypothetical protein
MRRTTNVYLIATIALGLFTSGISLAGQKHLGYARTLDDLRMARALLLRTNMGTAANAPQDEVSLAVENIDGAMLDISKETGSSVNPQDTPKIDSRMKWAQRLSKGFKMLDKAELDCRTEKVNSTDAEFQKRVLDRIDQAHDRIRVAIDTVNFDYSARNMPTRND